MASFLTALANIGNQYAEGRTAGLEEKEKLAQEKSRTELEQQQQAYQQRYLDYQSKLLEQKQRTGELLNTKWGLYNATSGQWIKPPAPDVQGAGVAALKQLLDDVKASPSLRAQVQDVYEGAMEDDPYNPAKARSAAVSYLKSEQDKITAEENKRLDRQTQNDFLRQMVTYRLEQRSQFMTAQERQQWESIKTVEPLVNRLGTFIEKNKLQDENDYVFGDRSALMQHLRMRGYTFGVAQEPMTQELIKDAAAISIMGAAPWVRIGRGRYTLEQIQQHLPLATDTPKNLYDKVIWFRDEVLADAKGSLSGLRIPGTTSVYDPEQTAAPASAGGPDTTAAPPPINPTADDQKAADAYLNSRPKGKP